MAAAKEQTNLSLSDPISQMSVGRDVEYRYLTFESDIPVRPVPPPALEASELPPCPDLRKYDNPFTWSPLRKKIITYLACSVNITVAYAVGSYASPASVLTKKWGISEVVFNIGITISTIGFGLAPMLLAPFSEINGRRPVFIACGVLYVVCLLGCALTQSYGGMLAARFFMGLGGSAFSTNVGGTLADVWVTADRNTPMVLFTGSTLVGTGLGPLVSGFVVQNLDWRWTFYLQVIPSGVLVALLSFFFKETRGSIILSNKAKALNKWYEQLEAQGVLGFEPGCSPLDVATSSLNLEKSGSKKSHTANISHYQRIRWKVKSDEDRASFGRMIALSLYRPFHMLTTESVVFWFSLWLAFCWAVLFLQFDSIPLVYETNYGFSLQETGAIFASLCVGAIISVALSIFQEKWALRSKFHDKLTQSPEGRLYFACSQAPLLPIGLFWFGWTCYAKIHWIVPTIGIGVSTMGIFSIYLATFNYFADVYQTYASSALAAAGLCRNLLGGAFPLVTKQMFRGLGFHAASSLLGGIGAALTLVPFVLVLFGPKIRARSKIASAFVE